MSYTELESGYQEARAEKPGFFVGDSDMYDQSDGGGMDSDCSGSSSNSGKQVIVGICAMAKKTQSKPMKEILSRIQEFEFIRMVIFPEEVILKEPVENWPLCDCLISFHSKGFPLDKAVKYAQLRSPLLINNLHMQFDIMDRRKVYKLLEENGISIPRYAVLDRDSPDPKHHELIESEDHVEVNGVVFNKPFVEKPVSAEDHNIYIYYPTSAGGGSQRLFRKIGSRSSVYSPESRVRKTGSFIYEDFMPTDGTDVKVYTVGPDYAHAEARKSPALDGKVERDSQGKEIRYPVILSNQEKMISRKVCLAFQQTVCGFDLLRASGKSFVCDVNGFSFVKNSQKYYDDCAKILGNMILRELAPTLHIPWSIPFQLDDPPIVPTTFGKMMELRCVVAVIRHGDRTPKQKMKLEVRHQRFFDIFEKYDGYKQGAIKLKKPKQLQEILDITRSLLVEIQTKQADPEIEEKQGKLEQLKSVLEMYGHFSGINRKVQMKYQPKGRPRGSSSDDDTPKEPSLVLILKWGGELTPAGRIQAEELGRMFRCMYPGGQSKGLGGDGLGLLRLHSTFRHDLKIYASDEGRVQMTAAAFAKGLLALEGELTPILVQMVKSANTNGLLDNDCESSKYQNMAKAKLHELMQTDREFTAEDREQINPGNSISINQALDYVKNPVKCCAHCHALIQSLIAIVTIKKDDPKTKEAVLYHGETWELMMRRWSKIEKDFYSKNKYDISKIPDIYDCIKYDLQHNQHTLQFDQAEELYVYAKYLADIVIPQEYGLTVPEKLTIGQGICTPLLKKIRTDLQRNIGEAAGEENVNMLNPQYSQGVSSPGRHVRTRLYFTSESHIHSLLTVLRHGPLLDMTSDEQWRRAMEYVSMVSELNYMSQIVIMLYEDPNKNPCSDERFHIELHFSPGVNCCVQKNLPPGPGFRPHSRNDSVTSKSNSGEEELVVNKIEEESDRNDTTPEDDFYPTNSRFEKLPTRKSDCDKRKRSRNVYIGNSHTVSGHEASDLAKRLSEELAIHQQNVNRSTSPDYEMRPRSLEQKHYKKTDHTHYQSLQAVYNQEDLVIDIELDPSFESGSATNELPLSAIKFSSCSRLMSCEDYDLPDSDVYDLILHNTRPKISPLATNEKPLTLPPLTCVVGSPPNPASSSASNSDFADFSFNSHDTTLGNDFLPFFPAEYSTSFPQLIARSVSCENLFEQPSAVVGRRDGAASNVSSSSMYITSPFELNTFNFLQHERNLRFGRIYSSSCETSLHQKTSHDDLCPSPARRNSASYASFYSYPGLIATPPLHVTRTSNSSLAPPGEQLCCDEISIELTHVATPAICINSEPYASFDENSPPSPSPQNLDDINNTTTIERDDAFSNSNNQLTNVVCPLTNSPHESTCDTIASSPIVVCCVSNDNDKNDAAAIAVTKPPSSPSSSSTTPATKTDSPQSGTRRQRHSIASGQMGVFKSLGFSRKMAASTNSLFSTAVISGSSSAPNLRDMIPSTATPSGKVLSIEGFGGVPPIRPLETLHNALSLKQLDEFLHKMASNVWFKTPGSSPPKYPSTPQTSMSEEKLSDKFDEQVEHEAEETKPQE
ncbi:inositol hexakisphosphate and diphosphoinositol-pentakisphosphate kinase isoform X3 [Culicoides brevitarsis]|uniref:inositol hexakisphosphate and diphosphoinositol-pentakisphosphate kinase isoform X3 n=1 Tax=Culicoides brevitarsis TaxID=469753 RepID=UPI00307B22AA